MGANTKIEWADHTFNPWRIDGDKRIVSDHSAWKKPMEWDREAKAAGVRHRVFCASVADVFEDWQGPIQDTSGKILIASPLMTGHNGNWPLTMQHVRHRLFEIIDATPNLDWLLLTKRPENIAAMVPSCKSCETVGRVRANCPHCNGVGRCITQRNVWIGTTVENQQAADERIPHLLRVPARVRFLSCEPLLGPVDLRRVGMTLRGDDWDVLYGRRTSYQYKARSGDESSLGMSNEPGHPRIHWVIAGGESGPHARPSHPDWFRSLRDQCTAAGVPFWFDGWGEWAPRENFVKGLDAAKTLTDIGYFEATGKWDTGITSAVVKYMVRVGKDAAGRLLDGKEWNEVPR